MKIHVVFYSTFGHVHQLAQAVADGARSVNGADVKLFQTAELMPEEALKKSGAMVARQAFSHVPVIAADELAEADAIIFGTPTRFGMMAAQMRNLLDQTGPLWAKGALVDKVGSVFTSTATQHGGQETTITSFHATLLHHGMIVVGVPYLENGISTMEGISGGGPYGASTVTGPDGLRRPSENELGVARFQGKHVAEITKALVQGRK
ncbi:MAG: NAD(P)H:quinone oxidoreductase [Deltaproteobacteria bacterium]|nr:NAD(P)H:quinone oxidoreductase [Deltaproteobacteria bacterium]